MMGVSGPLQGASAELVVSCPGLDRYGQLRCRREARFTATALKFSKQTHASPAKIKEKKEQSGTETREKGGDGNSRVQQGGRNTIHPSGYIIYLPISY